MFGWLTRLFGGSKPEYRIELFTGNGQQPYYWRLRHRNGNILCTSEGYANRSDRTEVAHKLLRAFKNGDSVVYADRPMFNGGSYYAIVLFEGGGAHRFYWRLVHRNGNILAHSEGYANKWDCEKTVGRLTAAIYDRALAEVVDLEESEAA